MKAPEQMTTSSFDLSSISALGWALFCFSNLLFCLPFNCLHVFLKGDPFIALINIRLNCANLSSPKITSCPLISISLKFLTNLCPWMVYSNASLNYHLAFICHTTALGVVWKSYISFLATQIVNEIVCITTVEQCIDRPSPYFLFKSPGFVFLGQ